MTRDEAENADPPGETETYRLTAPALDRWEVDSRRGLSDREAKHRRRRFGPNRLRAGRRNSVWEIKSTTSAHATWLKTATLLNRTPSIIAAPRRARHEWPNANQPTRRDHLNPDRKSR